MEERGEPTIRALRELVETSSQGNPHLTSRLEKAAFLVLLRRIASVGIDHYKVGSEDGLCDYEVINGHCQCHDYVRHGPGHPCKHRLALTMYLKLQGRGVTSSVSGYADKVTRRGLRA